MAQNVFEVGNFVRRGSNRVDPRLVNILKTTAAQFPQYRVELFSGYRPVGGSQHGKGRATDIRLIDRRTGQEIPNYQNAAGFRAYEEFAQAARRVQQTTHPELDRAFRWGGYFSGPKGKYGALDTMHFDLGGMSGLGMLGGSWERGLTPAQRRLFPGVTSRGMAGGPASGALALAMLPGAPPPGATPAGPPGGPRGPLAGPVVPPVRTGFRGPLAGPAVPFLPPPPSPPPAAPPPGAPPPAAPPAPGILSRLGGSLAGFAQSLAASNAQSAAMQQQGDAEWQAKYARTLGVPPAVLAQQMPTQPTPAVPLSTSPAVPAAAPVPTADEILAQIFGGTPTPAMLPKPRPLYG